MIRGGAALALPALLAAGACTDHASSPPIPSTLAIGASAGAVADPFTLAANGTAGAPYGAIAFTGDVGTLDVGNGPAAAFVYATVAEGAYTLYDGFAVSATDWDAFYLYCETGLADLYDERISGHGMVYSQATGTCSATTAHTTAQVSLPAVSLPAPAPITGYTVAGDAITVDADGNGTLVVGATTLPLVVFDTVDCTACGGNGWHELHSLAWDAAAHSALFVIVYLITGTADSVELAYARSLPDLGDPIGTLVLQATWTTPAARVQPGAPRTRGVPPPRAN